MSEDKLEVEGTVIESSKGIFRVKLENDHIVIGHLSGKMKMYKIRVLHGDTVTIELSPYDLKRGRIVRREKVENRQITQYISFIYNEEKLVCCIHFKTAYRGIYSLILDEYI